MAHLITKMATIRARNWWRFQRNRGRFQRMETRDNRRKKKTRNINKTFSWNMLWFFKAGVINIRRWCIHAEYLTISFLSVFIVKISFSRFPSSWTEMAAIILLGNQVSFWMVGSFQSRPNFTSFTKFYYMCVNVFQNRSCQSNNV